MIQEASDPMTLSRCFSTPPQWISALLHFSVHGHVLNTVTKELQSVRVLHFRGLFPKLVGPPVCVS